VQFHAQLADIVNCALVALQQRTSHIQDGDYKYAVPYIQRRHLWPRVEKCACVWYVCYVPDEVVVVNTSLGDVRGRVIQTRQGDRTSVAVEQYLGIPFAVPPVGQLRFADPVPLDRLPSGTLAMVTENPQTGTSLRDSTCLIIYRGVSSIGSNWGKQI